MFEQGKLELLPPAQKLKLSVLRRSSSPVVLFTKGGVLRNLAKFAGKHLCWSLCFIKVASLQPPILY